MKRLFSAALLLLIFSVSAFLPAAETETPAEPQEPAEALSTSPPEGSVPLWNGEDLSGWTVVLKNNAAVTPDLWKARKGVLHFSGKANGYVRTDKEFSNYHLHVEWRWTEKPGNSGVFVLQRPPDAVWPYSIQCNLKAGAAGDLIPQNGLEFPSGLKTKPKLAEANEKPAGQWNSCDLFSRGDSLEVLINGLKQNSIDKLPAASGQIALQLENTEIEFRNLWLQPL